MAAIQLALELEDGSGAEGALQIRDSLPVHAPLPLIEPSQCGESQGPNSQSGNANTIICMIEY